MSCIDAHAGAHLPGCPAQVVMHPLQVPCHLLQQFRKPFPRLFLLAAAIKKPSAGVVALQLDPDMITPSAWQQSLMTVIMTILGTLTSSWMIPLDNLALRG